MKHQRHAQHEHHEAANHASHHALMLADYKRRFWATGYNVIAIPLAAGALYKFGILLAPAVGALVMSISTIIVAINARLISHQR